jgi:hypothetical protein
VINKSRKRGVASLPKISYVLAGDDSNAETRLNRAFDLLFEETLRMETKNEIQVVPELPTGERLAIQGHKPESQGGRTRSAGWAT